MLEAFQPIVMAEIRSSVLTAFDEFNARGVRPILKAVEQAFSSHESRTIFTEANERLAEFARLGTVEAYEERVEGHKRHPSYRVGHGRLSGGVLSRALGRKRNYKGTYDSVYIGDMSYMDSQAAHWARLNWGTEGAGVNEPDYPAIGAQMKLGNKILSPWYPDADRAPSGQILMPPGFWSDKGDGRQARDRRKRTAPPGFYPTGPTADKPTQNGVGARRFFQEGALRVADHFPYEYEIAIDQIFEQFSKTKRGAAKYITVARGKIHL